jgi:hypothetical protein
MPVRCTYARRMPSGAQDGELSVEPATAGTTVRTTPAAVTASM